MAYSLDVAYVTLAYIGTLCLLLPLTLHIKARNTGTILMIFWGSLGLVTGATNAAIYINSTVNVAPHWCDFASIIGYVYSIGFTAGSLCLLRRLESIASTRQVRQIDSDQKKTLVIDLCLGVGLPLLVIPLHFIVQGHRANVIQGFGCFAPLYISLPSIFLFQLWQTVLSLACCIYAVLILRWFLIRRKQFTAVLASSNSGLSVNKYLRLMAMVSMEIFMWTPIALYVLIQYSFGYEKIRPWVSWDWVHYEFNTIVPFLRKDINPQRLAILEVGRWSGVAGAFVFFCFLGLTPEAISEYKKWFKSIGNVKGLVTRASKAKVSRHTTNSSAPTGSEISYLPSLAGDDVEKGSTDDAQVFYNSKNKDGEPSTADLYHMDDMTFSEGVRVQVERYVA